jgi:ABC-type dipeptide/oligopeptide/nickel transport system permease component
LAEFYGLRDNLHKVSIGYRLRERWWGKGLATETARLMVRYLYGETDIEIITASTMIENEASAHVLEKADFIRTARAKGVRAGRLLFVHALRSGLLPAVSYLGPAFAALITGSFVVETCFQVPGMGLHFVNATTDRDYFLIQGLVFCYGVLIVIANLAVDLVLVALNPRLRSQGAA